MRKYVRESIDPLVEDEMKTRPNRPSNYPSFPSGVYHAQASATNGHARQEEYGSHASYLASKKLSEGIKAEMTMLSEQQELLQVPVDLKERTVPFSKFYGKSENNALKNLLYGTTASGFNHCPEEPLGKDISNDYASGKDAQG